MYKTYTEEERLTLLKSYMGSRQSKEAFSKAHGFTSTTLTNWLAQYDFPDPMQIEDKLTSLGMPSEVDKLREELISLLKEKKRLEKELHNEKVRSLAYSTLIDLTESTYHIKVRKNSDAK